MARTVTRKCQNSCPWLPDNCSGDMVVRMRTVTDAPRGWSKVFSPWLKPSFSFLEILIHRRQFLIQGQTGQTTTLCIGVGYLASLTIKYTEGSSDGVTVYNVRELLKIRRHKLNCTIIFWSDVFSHQIKAKLPLLKHVLSTSSDNPMFHIYSVLLTP